MSCHAAIFTIVPGWWHDTRLVAGCVRMMIWQDQLVIALYTIVIIKHV